MDNKSSLLCSAIAELKDKLNHTLERSRKLELEHAERKRQLEEELSRVMAGSKARVAVMVMELHKKLEEEANCAICSEVFINASVTRCGHAFCQFCITEWIAKGEKIERKVPLEFAECPICRKPTSNNPVKHVNLDNFITAVYSKLPEEVQKDRQVALEDRLKEIEASQAKAAREAVQKVAEAPAEQGILEIIVPVVAGRRRGRPRVARSRAQR